MTVILNDGTELAPLDISGEPTTVQGETRDSLVFDFPASAGLEAINSAFSPENCESIRLIEDSGTEHVHAGYVLRVSLTLTPVRREERVRLPLPWPSVPTPRSSCWPSAARQRRPPHR